MPDKAIEARKDVIDRHRKELAALLGAANEKVLELFKLEHRVVVAVHRIVSDRDPVGRPVFALQGVAPLSEVPAEVRDGALADLERRRSVPTLERETDVLVSVTDGDGNVGKMPAVLEARNSSDLR